MWEKCQAALRNWLTGGIGKEGFRRYQSELDNINAVLVKKAACVALCIAALFSVFSVFFFNDAHLQVVYAVSFMVLLALYLMIHILLPRFGYPHLLVNSACFFLMTIVLGIGLVIGVFENADGVTALFWLFMGLLPILFVFPLWQTYSIQVISYAVCVGVSYWIKPADIALMDMCNGLVTLLLSVVASHHMICTRIREVEMRVQLQHMCVTDELTCLPNRRRFNQYIDTMFQRSKTEQQNLAIFILDVDDFKLYNDQYGHLAGDECLRQIGVVLSKVEQQGVFVSRFGGEEFVGVAYGKNREEMLEIGEYIRSRVESYHISNILSLRGHITVSIGIADTVSSDVQTYMELISCSDQALYEVKAGGKNQVQHYKKPEQTNA